MSDLDNLNALKRMFENDIEKKQDEILARERRFIADAAKAYLGDKASDKAIREYEPEKMIAYLQKPAKEIQKELGGEWMDMGETEFEVFVYSIEKKVKKSTLLCDWKK